MKSGPKKEASVVVLRRKNLSAIIQGRYQGKQSLFIDKTGINQGELSEILKGNRSFGEKKARKLEQDADLRRGYLDMEHKESNVLSDALLEGSVPIIEWPDAGRWKEAIDKVKRGEVCEHVTASTKPGENTFALKVHGDSMVNPIGSPSIPDGCIIIVDPDRHYKDRDFVIAKDGNHESVFKQIIKDGADWYLTSLNPRYPIKPLGTSIIIGVVIEALIKLI